MIVVDANILAYRFVQGDKTALTRQAQERDPDWVVPPLWQHEFLNVLATLGRERILTPAQCAVVWEGALSAMRPREQPVDLGFALSIALREGITAYDAQYIALARSLGIPCLTEDRKLIRTCPKTAVSLKEFFARRMF
ncbi:MAG: type II toxin-antitoxin system VapC family toxin [Candidatus Sumerlaeota bacterium]|nr:type II toxin-antitoxin system VapC family toxin [Candidatus Sumerlaeota bacterium]